MNAPRILTLAFLAEHTGARVDGDSGIVVSRVATLRLAGSGDIAFLSNPKYRAEIVATSASAVIVAPEFANLGNMAKLVHANPYACFAHVARLLDPHPAQAMGVDPSASVAATATIGRDVSIGAQVVIGDGAMIGDGSILYPHVTIYPRVRIGRNAIIHAQAVIGSDGFGFANQGGAWVKIPQTGSVLVGDDVEVGAGTTIDRGALDDTVIGDGVKLDNQIQVGHNVRIGAHTALAGCVGIAGSATIGRYCTVGGGAIILGHLTIADHVNISAGTMVTRSIPAAGTYSGAHPMAPHREWLRSAVRIRHLDDMEERVRDSQQRVAALEARIKQLETKA